MGGGGARQQRRGQEKRQKQLQKKLDKETKRLRFSQPPEILRLAGPIIETDLGIAQKHIDLLRAASRPIPPKVRCRFLIDTGASCTLVKHDIAARAGLKMISAHAPVRGIGVDTSGKIFMGRIWFGLRSNVEPTVVHQMMVDTMIQSGNLAAGDHIDGLIGRDVLSYFHLGYDGSTGEFVLTWKGPRP